MKVAISKKCINKNKAVHSAYAKTEALVTTTQNLIICLKNIVPELPDFVQKIIWLPAPG
jgi:hypothetical protein